MKLDPKDRLIMVNTLKLIPSMNPRQVYEWHLAFNLFIFSPAVQVFSEEERFLSF